MRGLEPALRRWSSGRKCPKCHVVDDEAGVFDRAGQAVIRLGSCDRDEQRSGLQDTEDLLPESNGRQDVPGFAQYLVRRVADDAVEGLVVEILEHVGGIALHDDDARRAAGWRDPHDGSPDRRTSS
jgi:hypothetical protein